MRTPLELHFVSYADVITKEDKKTQNMSSRLQTTSSCQASLLGPWILAARLNGEMYSEFLCHHLTEVWEDVPLAILRRMWYLHNGLHFAKPVTKWPNDIFPNR